MFDPEIAKFQNRAIELCQKFNTLLFTSNEEKEKILKHPFGSYGHGL